MNDIVFSAAYLSLALFSLLIVLTGGPKNAMTVLRTVLGFVVSSVRLSVVAAVNSFTFAIRLVAAGGSGAARANAWATYVERMTDLFVIHTWRKRPPY